MAPRRLLLVGEGNFSFAVALSETLDPNTSLTATCPQRSADLARDLVVRENLQRLRERGSEAQPSTKPRPPRSPAQLWRPQLSGKGGNSGDSGSLAVALGLPRGFPGGSSGKEPACQCES